MVSASASDDNSNLIKATLEWIADAGINGLGVLPSAEQVAAEHLSKAASVEDAIDSVIAWGTTYAVGTGFITGLGIKHDVDDVEGFHWHYCLVCLRQSAYSSSPRSYGGY